LEGDDGKLPDATHLFWKTSRDDRVAHCADVIRSAGARFASGALPAIIPDSFCCARRLAAIG